MAIDLAEHWIFASAPLTLVGLVLAFATAELFGRRRLPVRNLVLKYGLCGALAAAIFWLYGYGLAFGMSFEGYFGLSGFLPWAVSGPAPYGFFAGQAVLAAVAVFIVIAAQSRRMTLRGYLLGAAFFASLIYPLTTHWIWGAQGPEGGEGWLRAGGFIDQAGAAAVHMVGGWAALALSLALGPRKPFKINLPCNFAGPYTAFCGMASLALFALCWNSFLDANLSAMAARADMLYLKLICAGAGAFVIANVFVLLQRRFFGFWYSTRAVLAGFIAVSAGIDVVSLQGAVVLGGLAAIACMSLSHTFYRLSIEDASSTIAVHLGGGLTGTLLLPLFVPSAIFGAGTAASQLIVQLQGVFAVGLFVFASMFIFMRLVMVFTPLRIADRDLVKRAQAQFESARSKRKALSAAAPAEPDAAPAVAEIDEIDLPVSGAPASQPAEAGEDEDLFAEAKPVVSPRPTRGLTPTDILEIKIQNESLSRSLRRQTNDLEQSRRELQSLNNQLNDLTSAFVMSERTKHSLFRLSQNIFSTHIQEMQAITAQAHSPRAMEKLPHLIHEKSIEHARTLAGLKIMMEAMEANLPRDQQDIDLKRMLDGVKLKYNDKIFSKELIVNIRHGRAVQGIRGNAQNVRVICELLLERAIQDNISGGLVHIEVGLDSSGGAFIEFVDSGKGYTAEDLAEALDPLNLEDDPARDVASSLGYGLVRRLVELHRGTLKVSSQLGVGTKVVIVWPAEKTRLTHVRAERAYV